MNAERECDRCEYYDFANGSVCRHHAPTTSGFPIVELDDWCGEFVQFDDGESLIEVEEFVLREFSFLLKGNEIVQDIEHEGKAVKAVFLQDFSSSFDLKMDSRVVARALNKCEITKFRSKDGFLFVIDEKEIHFAARRFDVNL